MNEQWISYSQPPKVGKTVLVATRTDASIYPNGDAYTPGAIGIALGDYQGKREGWMVMVPHALNDWEFKKAHVVAWMDIPKLPTE